MWIAFWQIACSQLDLARKNYTIPGKSYYFSIAAGPKAMGWNLTLHPILDMRCAGFV